MVLLQWKRQLKEEAKLLELQRKVRGFEISQCQILGEGHYADIVRLHFMNTPCPYAEHQP